jgi:hypothetical protein
MKNEIRLAGEKVNFMKNEICLTCDETNFRVNKTKPCAFLSIPRNVTA